MKKLAIMFAVGAAALMGGSAAYADNAVEGETVDGCRAIPDCCAILDRLQLAHRHRHWRGHHHRHWGHRHYRPYYRSYGYYAPRPYGYYGVLAITAVDPASPSASAAAAIAAGTKMTR